MCISCFSFCMDGKKDPLSGRRRLIQRFLDTKGCEQESRLCRPVRELRLVERGAVTAAEDGLGAGMAIGSHSRVRPSLRQRGSGSCEPRWYRVNFLSPLKLSGAAFFFEGGCFHV